MQVPGPLPDGCQAGNRLLDPEFYREKAGSFSPFDLPALADPAGPPWTDGHSISIGCSDKIPIEAKGGASGSLRLIGVEEIAFRVFAPGEAPDNSKRRGRGRFVHAGQDYAFWVTDPGYERRYLGKLDGTCRIGECHLTISLGEPYRGDMYKLIAAIIEPDGQQ